MVAPAGAGPWPQITSVLPLRTSLRMTGTSPPGPLRCGSTTCSVKAVATAASKALPPFSRVAMPTAVAIQWVEVTTPNVPSISGRVVKGFGLMFFIGCFSSVGPIFQGSTNQLLPRRSIMVWAGRVVPTQNAGPAIGGTGVSFVRRCVEASTDDAISVERVEPGGGGLALGDRQHHDLGADLDAAVEVDHVVVGHADASG